MTGEFNKQTLFSNITFLIKEKGMKVGELETAAGVSPGYISRTRDGGTKPGIDFVMGAAETLGVSVDTLLKGDLTALSPTDQYLISFLEKLKSDSLEYKIEWESESVSYLNSLVDPLTADSHPLIRPVYAEDENGIPYNTFESDFYSHSFGSETEIAGECFNFKIEEAATLYVMNFGKFHYSAIRAKEIWLCPEGSSAYFLCSSTDSKQFELLIGELYAAAKRSVTHPKVRKDIRSIIDGFMNRASVSSDNIREASPIAFKDLVDTDDEDEELPF